MPVQIFQYPSDSNDPEHKKKMEELAVLKADGWRISKGPSATTLQKHDLDYDPTDKKIPSVLQLYLIKDWKTCHQARPSRRVLFCLIESITSEHPLPKVVADGLLIDRKTE